MAETKSTTAKTRTTAKAEATMADMMAIPSMEVPTAVRELAEKSIEQAKDSYAKFKSAAEEATDLMEDSFESSRQGVLEINMKALDAAKTSSDATFAFLKDMLAVKSFAEAIELQTSFAHKQFDTALAQSKELQDLVAKVATDATKPAKDVFSKSFKGFPAA